MRYSVEKLTMSFKEKVKKEFWIPIRSSDPA